MRLVHSLILLAAVAVLPVNIPAADWPNFRGPTHNGISTETGWQVKWPADGPKQLWKASLGYGYAPINVAQGRAFASGNRDTTATLHCFDAQKPAAISGHSPIRAPYIRTIMRPTDSAAPAVRPPLMAIARIYIMSRNGCPVCIESAGTGGVVWSNDLYTALRPQKPTWGFSTSPLVQGGLLVLGFGGGGTAVDKATGKLVWNVDDSLSGYSTPVPCSLKWRARRGPLRRRGLPLARSKPRRANQFGNSRLRTGIISTSRTWLFRGTISLSRRLTAPAR